MAFVGRINIHGNYVDCSAISNGRSKLKRETPVPVHATDKKIEMEDRPTNYSRTYIKLYDSEQLPSPPTARYVDHSASSCDLNSMADTEESTLRYSSPRSFETEMATLRPSSCSSDNGSTSDGSRDAVVLVEVERPHQPLRLEHCRMEAPRLERGSTTSMCSWEEEETVSMYPSMDEQTAELETQSSCYVPQLELGSDTASLYYDQQVQLDQLKVMRRSNEAYNNWLSAKKRQHQYKQQAELEQRQLKQQKDAQRRQLNEQRVQEWCERKARQSTNTFLRKANTEKTQTTCHPQPYPHPQLDEVALKSLQCWEMKKAQQAEQRFQIQQREAQRKQQQQQQRKQQATLAWQQWMKGVAQRPKPVPLNQGMKTLSGTISDIYINPNEWIHIADQTRN
ncbi:coiled-coil domain-containing protein 34 [Drosophila grimshawi]|uniref:GH10701 n=1 Tax=Drosophila grimshawi TaxID=7222 RepID=B4JC49_DROGR|nr:coiled-coil domain-containing protein 34 [Drosophila grimshawi]EDW03062.1 GH10701 [Drosophila grimshawi]